MFNKVVMAVIAATATNAISLNKAPVPNQSHAENAMARNLFAAQKSAKAIVGQMTSPKQHKDVKDFMKEHAGAVTAAESQFPPGFIKEMKKNHPEEIKAFKKNPRKALKAFVKKHPGAIEELVAKHKAKIDSFCGANEQNEAACGALKDFFKSTIENNKPAQKTNQDVKDFVNDHAGAIAAAVSQFPGLIKEMEKNHPEEIKAFKKNPRKALKAFVKKHPGAIEELVAKHKAEIDSFCGATKENEAACGALKQFYESTVKEVHQDVKDFLKDHAGAIAAAMKQFSGFIGDMEAKYPGQVAAFKANPTEALKALVNDHPNVIGKFLADHKDKIDSFCGENDENKAACGALKEFYMKTIQ